MHHTGSHSRRRALARAVLPILILAAAVALSVGLLKSPPEVPKSEPEKLVAVVGVAELVARDVPVFVEAFGTVGAARETQIQPEVSGRISMLHANLVSGGRIGRDEILFEIDRSDHELAVAEAEASVSVARLQVDGLRANFRSLQKQAEQVAAELDYLRWNAQRLGRLSENEQAGEVELREAQSDFLSRQAALAALEAQAAEQQYAVERATAQVRVAESRLATAELALARTRVRSPFDAIVLSESVEVGQLIGPQTTVATLAATDEYWVEAALPVSRLSSIRFFEDHPESPSSAVVAMSTGEKYVEMEGVALRSLGRLDPEGRMVRALISVRDPLNLEATDDGPRESLLLGSYVRLKIEAGVLEDVFLIPRYALRENNRVWVRDRDGNLAIRQVDVVWRRQDDVLVPDAFAPGDRLVTTHLASVVPGMPLTVRETAPEAAAHQSDDGASDQS